MTPRNFRARATIAFPPRRLFIFVAGFQDTDQDFHFAVPARSQYTSNDLPWGRLLSLSCHLSFLSRARSVQKIKRAVVSHSFTGWKSWVEEIIQRVLSCHSVLLRCSKMHPLLDPLRFLAAAIAGWRINSNRTLQSCPPQICTFRCLGRHSAEHRGWRGAPEPDDLEGVEHFPIER
jgi:hypothetical protein